MCSCLLCEKAGQWKHVENADHSTWVWDEPVTHSTWYTCRGHSHTSPLYVCVWVCEYVSSGTFVCWGGKAPPTQGHLMRGEGRHEGECERQRQGEINERKEKTGLGRSGQTLQEASESMYLPVPRHRGFKGLANHIVVHSQVLVRMKCTYISRLIC